MSGEKRTLGAVIYADIESETCGNGGFMAWAKKQQ
jgi:hypothetical protein